MNVTTESAAVKMRRDKKRFAEQIKLKAKILYQTLMECQTNDGRRLIFPFLENPNKEFQPYYYEVSYNGF